VRALDNLKAIVAGEQPGPPVAQLLGMRLIEVEDGRAVFEVDADDRFWNPMGTVHGGILCDLADAALGVCWAATLDEGETFTTVELKINFLRPVRDGRLRAVGTVTKRGRHIGMTECESLTRRTPRGQGVGDADDVAGRAGRGPLGSRQAARSARPLVACAFLSCIVVVTGERKAHRKIARV
jgi:uncharacterized domain 1